MTAVSSSSIRSEKAFRWWDYPVFVSLSILSLWGIVSLLVHWFSLADLLQHPISFSLMTVILLVILTNNQGRWFLLPYMRKPVPMAPKAGWRVAVLTAFTPPGEPLEMLEQTVKALVALDYPHDTWVLDEGDGEEVRSLCRRLGAKHFSRKGLPQYHAAAGVFQSASKHGNYNAWLHAVGFDGYDIVTTFDSDHLPRPSFLTQVLGYFNDDSVAYAQVAQAYYNQKASFIARGAAEETYAYYSSVQMAGYGMGYPIIVGCHNTHRVAALKQIGGLAAHDAEDLLLTLNYRANGWHGVYVPMILARGLTPVDWPGYLRQQRRWARSVLDIKLRRYSRLSRNLSGGSRIMSLLHGLNYLHRTATIVLSIFVTALIMATGETPAVVSYLTVKKLAILCVVLQICEFYRQRFYLDWRNEWGFHWRVAVLHYAKWPWFLLALFDVLFKRQRPYLLTPKVKALSKEHLLMWPNLAVIAVLLSSWFASRISAYGSHPIVYVCAALFLVASTALIWTEFWDFPSPYEEELQKDQPQFRSPAPQGRGAIPPALKREREEYPYP
jgi:cellulose synthase/poly-beta-1,6-N-acetylglucosamine synthase-like glycosyltransferase